MLFWPLYFGISLGTEFMRGTLRTYPAVDGAINVNPAVSGQVKVNP